KPQTKMSSRRDFIKATTLASASLMMPKFLFAGAGSTLQNGKKLVVIQFSGGNDGLNTVIPFRTDTYYEMRPDIAIFRDEVLRIKDDAGLNPNLPGLADLYNDGHLAIVNTVGYPNPNRSHFRSMDIWQSGSGANEYLETGWIGRTLDSTCDN